MSYDEAMDQTESDEVIWHVQLASGDVELMTLDELDGAFQNGVIHEGTFLWQEGATGWVTLGEVAGLDEDEPSEEIDAVEVWQRPLPKVQVADSVWPAVSAAPIYLPPAPNPFLVVSTNSTAPVAGPPRGLDFDLDSVDFGRKKSSGGKWLFAAVLLGAAGFGAVKAKLVRLPDLDPGAPAAAAMLSPVPAETVATPPPASPPPVAAAPTPAPEPAKETILADDVKQRLAAADKTLAEKQKQKQIQRQQSRPAPRARNRPSSGEKVFHKGGETGDPLNSAL